MSSGSHRRRGRTSRYTTLEDCYDRVSLNPVFRKAISERSYHLLEARMDKYPEEDYVTEQTEVRISDFDLDSLSEHGINRKDIVRLKLDLLLSQLRFDDRVHAERQLDFERKSAKIRTMRGSRNSSTLNRRGTLDIEPTVPMFGPPRLRRSDTSSSLSTSSTTSLRSRSQHPHSRDDHISSLWHELSAKRQSLREDMLHQKRTEECLEECVSGGSGEYETLREVLKTKKRWLGDVREEIRGNLLDYDSAPTYYRELMEERRQEMQCRQRRRQREGEV